MLFPHVIFAQNSAITAEICSANGPGLIISSPKDDSVINQQTITLSGKAERTSQIDVFLNGQYSQSVAIGSDKKFSLPITLNLGSNTLLIKAFYNCNHTTYEEGVAVTYDPNAKVGRPTTVTPPAGRGAPKPNLVSNPEVIPINEQPPGVIQRIEDNFFGWDNSWVIPLISWLSLIITLISAIFVLYPHYIVNWIHKSPSLINTPSPRLVRIVALVIAVLFATIVQA